VPGHAPRARGRVFGDQPPFPWTPASPVNSRGNSGPRSAHPHLDHSQIRVPAEKLVNDALKQPGAPMQLLELIASQSNPEVRQLAAIVLRKKISR